MKTLTTAVVLATLLTGCAESPNYGYNGYGNYGARQQSGVSNTVKGAGIGALGGAAVGALATKDRAKGALIGAGVGAVVGGGAGYYMDKKQEQQQMQAPPPPPYYYYGPQQ